MNNRLQHLFKDKEGTKLSVFFTAGFPQLEDTVSIIQQLEQSGVDFIEIGFPFSDPLADGPVIQDSSATALKNGMHLALLFQQLQDIRTKVQVPLLLMGYLNPVLQFGMTQFVQACHAAGIDGVIIPDLPVDIYTAQYRQLFAEYNISFIPLITPATSNERMREIDAATEGFIYMVSVYGTTGRQVALQEQQSYFERVRSLQLRNPLVAGFGIQSNDDIQFVSRYCSGAIVGSAFIRHLQQHSDLGAIPSFIKKLQP